jgi:DNA-binding transcriptional LysR family regulator
LRAWWRRSAGRAFADVFAQERDELLGAQTLVTLRVADDADVARGRAVGERLDDDRRAVLGVSIMPQIALNAEDRSSIIIKPLADRTPTRDIGVIRHTQRYQSLGAEQFIALLREHVGKRPPR